MATVNLQRFTHYVDKKNMISRVIVIDIEKIEYINEVIYTTAEGGSTCFCDIFTNSDNTRITVKSSIDDLFHQLKEMETIKDAVRRN